VVCNCHEKSQRRTKKGRALTGLTGSTGRREKNPRRSRGLRATYDLRLWTYAPASRHEDEDQADDQGDDAGQWADEDRVRAFDFKGEEAERAGDVFGGEVRDAAHQ
jgi:hypothetical protein